MISKIVSHVLQWSTSVAYLHCTLVFSFHLFTCVSNYLSAGYIFLNSIFLSRIVVHLLLQFFSEAFALYERHMNGYAKLRFYYSSYILCVFLSITFMVNEILFGVHQQQLIGALSRINYNTKQCVHYKIDNIPSQSQRCHVHYT